MIILLKLVKFKVHGLKGDTAYYIFIVDDGSKSKSKTSDSSNFMATMSAKSPLNTHTVLGIFQPRPTFAAEMTIVSPLPPSYNVESIAEVLSYLERYHFSLQCCSYHLQTTNLYGGGDFVVHSQHKLQEVFQDFWQTLYIRII